MMHKIKPSFISKIYVISIKMSQDKKFSCPHFGCSKTFVTKGNMNNHYFSHFDNKPFQCSFGGCDKSYANNYRLQIHERTHVIINMIINLVRD